MLLGILLASLGGMAVMFEALVIETEDGETRSARLPGSRWASSSAPTWFWHAAGGLAKFGVPAMGLIAAIYALVFIASLAGDKFSLQGSRLILATVLAVISATCAFICCSSCSSRCGRLSSPAKERHGSVHNLSIGFGAAFTLQNLLYCFLGCLLGTLVGVLPGIGPVATIAMLLPATYALPPVAALIMLAGIYYGSQYGGSTTAILVNLPGESSSVVTVIDGYQMARRAGRGRRWRRPAWARSLPAAWAR
jgi:hypothetical protein